MSDTGSKPPEHRRKRILEVIQTSDYDVLTTSEIAAEISDVKRKKSVKRNLQWMKNHDFLDGRQAGDNNMWIWWVSSEKLSSEDGVATARQVGLLLRELYEKRWEFQLIAVGAVLLPLSLSLAVWVVLLSELGITLLSVRGILAMIGAAAILSLVVVFIGLFLFPIETYGDWTRVTENDAGKE